MAKIHKGIATGSGFAYKGKDLNFSRDVYDNFTDLLEDEAKYGFPDGFKVVVKDATVGSEDYYDNKSYNNSTFIYKFVDSTERMLNWHCVAYDHIDEYLYPVEEKLFKLQGIGGICHYSRAFRNDKYVWNTADSYTDLNDYALKSDVTTDLSNYVTNSALTTTLGSYAKLNNSANFSALTVGNKSVATEEWTTQQIGAATTQALTYKGGIANQSDITNAEATGTIKVGNVYVCTTENNYTLNGGTVRLEAGDTIICKSITGTEKWNIVQANITGAVTKSSNLASGQLVVGTGLSSVKALDAGANGKFLKVENNVLTWGDVPVYGLNNGSPHTNGLVPLPTEDDKTGSFLSMDGTWKIPYGDATTTTHGLMTAADKVKLNGIEAGANKYSHPATHPATMITGLANVATSGSYSDLSNKPGTMNGASSSASGTSGFVPAPVFGQQGLFLRGDGTWAKPTDTIYKLKAATDGNLGGIKIGYMSDVTHKRYAVELDDEKAFVTVPWTNTTYEKFKPATDGLVPAPGADNTTKFLRGDGSWVMPADTVYTAGTGISIDNKVIKNTGIRTLDIDLAEGSNDTIAVNINGSAKTISITDVRKAYTAVTAVKVANALTIKSYNDDGSIDTVTYDGSAPGKTIECVSVSDINKLFPS